MITEMYHQMHGSEEDKVLHSCYTHDGVKSPQLTRYALYQYFLSPFSIFSF